MRLAWLVVPALVVSAVACGGVTKAGGEGQPHTVVLTIANNEPGDRDLAEYVAAVTRLSGDSIRLVPRDNWRRYQLDPHRGTVVDVRAGKVHLAKIAVRSYDRLGVNDFQAVMAPFLVDSLAVEQKLLASRLPNKMLVGIRRLGVEGLAMLPGAPRRPFGLDRPLLGPSDYRGAVIGVGSSHLQARTMRSLGAIPRVYSAAPGHLPPWIFDGAELDPLAITSNDYAIFRRSSLTANVAFWPQALTVIGNRSVLAQLTSRQRAILRKAAREALAPAIARLQVEARQQAGLLCRGHQVAFVEATPSQVTALRAAVRPVFTRIERHPKTRSLVREIEAMKRESPPERALQCPPSSPPAERAITALDGTWEMTATRAQVIETTRDLLAGEDQGATTQTRADVDFGRYRLVVRRGRFSLSHLGPTNVWETRGVFRVRGGTVLFRFNYGEDASYLWNVYRDTLKLEYDPRGLRGTPSPTFAPWRRVR